MKKLLFISLFIFSILSCSKKVTEHIISSEKLPKYKDKELIHKLDSLSNTNIKTFYSKIKVNYSDSERSISFKTSLKMICDSALNALITYTKIPVISTLISTDSITILNRTKKCYNKGNLDYFKNQFGVEIGFENLEELFLGQPIDFDNTQKYFVINDPYQYTITSHRKRLQKKMERKQKEDIILTYHLNDNTTKLRSTNITSIGDSAHIQIDYLTYQTINEFSVPKRVKLRVNTPQNNIEVFLDYEKVEINNEEELILIIPKSYEECN